MAAGPPGHLMRKHGDTVCRVYYGDKDDPKDAEFAASDSESSSAASSVASSKEEHLREVEEAAAKVRKQQREGGYTKERRGKIG